VNLPAKADQLLTQCGLMRLGASRRAWLAVTGAALLSAAWAAYPGASGRLLSIRLCLAALLTVSVIVALRERRLRGSAVRRLRLSLGRHDPQLSERLLRALDTRDRVAGGLSPGSPALADAHLHKVLDAVDIAGVVATVKRRLLPLRLLTLACACGAIVLLLMGPVRLLIGFDLLLSQSGRAPISLGWLETIEPQVKAPSYLDRLGEWTEFWPQTRIPQGTTLRLRGEPRLPARHLVLTDGASEVAFNAEKDGTLVAEWRLDKDVTLWIAARFGDILIRQDPALDFEIAVDATPLVLLQGAPSTRELESGTNLPLQYRALDDHGLRSLHLTLQCGTRTERRPLAQLDGKTLFFEGAEQLSADDRFIARCHLPLTIRIEAGDDDPLKSDRPGRSAALTVVPPAIGKAEATRAALLQSLLTQLIGVLLSLRDPNLRADELNARWRDAEATLLAASERSSGGAPLPVLLSRFMAGQAKRLTSSEVRLSGRQQRLVDVLLALDSAFQSQSGADSARVARALADVAEDARLAARDLRGEAQQSAHDRLSAATSSLALGANHLNSLGELGADLGGLVRSELRRMKRAREAEHFGDVAIIAAHLAARLRRPVPSFSSQGGSGGGVESGQGSVAPLTSHASDAAKRFERLSRELQRLTEDHAAEVRSTEELSEAETIPPASPLSQSLRRLAQQARSAVAGLPEAANDPSSPEASATAARSHAESLARELEGARLEHAMGEGTAAIERLQDATRRSSDDDSWRGAALRAQDDLHRVVQEARAARAEIAQVQRANWKVPLREAALREAELARRAGNLAGQGRGTDAELPSQAVESLERAERWMEQATDSMSAGDAQGALELQRQAQQALEEMVRGKQGQRTETAPNTPSDSNSSASEGEVPEPLREAADAEFRRRVLEGLRRADGKPSSEALRRYTEDLLR
jgi:phage terminase small subunit